MKMSAIILAGGKSSRMGQDKGLMPLNGEPMVQKIINTAKEITDTILIISNNKEYEQFGYPVFEDEIKDQGPMAGIYTGLLHSSTPKNLILSCDVPFVQVELLKELINKSDDFDITIPRKDDKTHQLIGVINKSCLASFKNNIDNNQLKLKIAYEALNLNVIDANQFDKKMFTNINSKDDIKA